MRDFFAFRRMITAYLIKGLYILVAIGIPIAAIAGMAMSLLNFIEALGIFIGGEILWRLVCEGMIILFSLHEALTDSRGYLRP